jgi:hypothetical protein
MIVAFEAAAGALPNADLIVAANAVKRVAGASDRLSLEWIRYTLFGSR